MSTEDLRDNVHDAFDRHTHTILTAARAALSDTDGVPDDPTWDGVVIMFDLVDGRIPVIYTNVSVYLPDDTDGEIRDQLDTAVDHELARIPVVQATVERLHASHGNALITATTFIPCEAEIDESDVQADTGPVGQQLTASTRRAAATTLARQLNVTRRRAYDLLDRDLPAGEVGGGQRRQELLELITGDRPGSAT